MHEYFVALGGNETIRDQDCELDEARKSVCIPRRTHYSVSGIVERTWYKANVYFWREWYGFVLRNLMNLWWQIENEYGNIDWEYGPKAKSYIEWAAELATSMNAGVPWVMCQQNNAPQSMVSSFLVLWTLGYYIHTEPLLVTSSR